MSSFLTSLTSMVTWVISTLGDVVEAFFDSTNGVLGDLLPFLAISLGLSIAGWAIAKVVSFVRH